MSMMSENPMTNAANAGASRLASMAPGKDSGKQAMTDVRYRAADNPQQSCGTCTYFDGQAGCQLVAGNIDPKATCDLWASDTGPEGPPPPAGAPTPGGSYP